MTLSEPHRHYINDLDRKWIHNLSELCLGFDCKFNVSFFLLPSSVYSMFSKTWRVHAIFTDIKLNKKVSSSLALIRDNNHNDLPVLQLIKDYKLFMVVGILVFIDWATLTTWQIVDPFYRATSQGKPEVSSVLNIILAFGFCCCCCCFDFTLLFFDTLQNAITICPCLGCFVLFVRFLAVVQLIN